VSYVNFLAVLISYGDKIRQHWPLILAAYQALVALYQALGKEIPGEGTLQLVSPSEDEMNAEERLAFLIDGDVQAVSAPGRFRKVFEFLKASGLLDVLLGKVLGS
tara:strand:+ start:156 stop:470 length:315 start_codon:yes stop_codon:yes gene_type:complete